MNVLELKAEIARSGRNKRELAAAIGMEYGPFWSRTTGRTDFRVTEISALCRELGLTVERMLEIFFENGVN